MTAPLKNRDALLGSAEPLVRRATGSLISHQHRVSHAPARENARKPLRVMKFGGTSVADASGITRVVDIVQAAVLASDVVVVVSAMSGVTNKLVEAAALSTAGNREMVAAIFKDLKSRHESAASALIDSAEQRQRIDRTIRVLIRDASAICEAAIIEGELTLRARDSIVGLGERLSAPLVAAALAARGVASEAIEATEIVVTDACHGAAEPQLDLTRERCEARLRPLLLQGTVAVVTGFIGATVDGALTTLGRNSSDFSGTIVGAALDADEVTLWTDVDGILTADPRIVPDARSILEMSYSEAADLAELGAKVLHPKTLRPVMQRGIPLSIRNTFAPDLPGTKITAAGPCGVSEVKALAAAADVALITLRGSSDEDLQDVLRRALSAAATAQAEVRLVARSSSSPNEVSFVVSSELVEATTDALRREFARELAHGTPGRLDVDSSVAVLAVVGESPLRMHELVGRVLDSLKEENLRVLASAHEASQSSISIVVAREDVKAALVCVHRKLGLSEIRSSDIL
jgi:bifunctional aspartokinase / homoserine dehydrogenase 1